MRWVRIHEHGGPETLRVEDGPELSPGPGEMRVKVAAAGVNFIDVYQRRGLYKVPLPHPMGHEGAGVVEAVGEGVVGFEPGSRVAWCSAPGSYATHAIVVADRAVLVPMDVDLKIAAAVLLQGLTAHYLAHDAHRLTADDACIVHAAAGGTGLLLTQIAKRRGARVLATVSTEEKAALAREAGADVVVRYTEEDFVAAAKEMTRGRGVDVVYDSVGQSTFDKSLQSLAVRGTLVLFGQSSGPVPPFDPQRLNAGGSLYLTRPTLAHYTRTPDELRGRANDLLSWIPAGHLSVRIGATFSLEDVGKAQASLESRSTTGKVVLLP